MGLASRLYKAGAKQHLGILTDALADPARTVRYFAALQLSTLGPAGHPAVPVLKKIVAEEKDEDLVERAKLGLLRLEPGALGATGAPPSSGLRASAGWIRVRIYEKGDAKPKVSVNLPVALAEMVFKSLPDVGQGRAQAKGLRRRQFLGPAAQAGALRDHQHRGRRRRARADLAGVGGEMRGNVWAMACLVLAPAVSFGGTADDDLAVVKKAVAQSSPAAPDPTGPRADRPPSDKLRWLKVRVTEKTGKKVSINLPLTFARALGEDWPVNIGCRKGQSRLTLGDILRSLEAGQDIVEVDSDDAKVRVWVE